MAYRPIGAERVELASEVVRAYEHLSLRGTAQKLGITLYMARTLLLESGVKPRHEGRRSTARPEDTTDWSMALAAGLEPGSSRAWRDDGGEFAAAVQVATAPTLDHQVRGELHDAIQIAVDKAVREVLDVPA